MRNAPASHGPRGDTGGKAPLRLSEARHNHIQMMRLVEKEELYPKGKAHFPKEWMERPLGSLPHEIAACSNELFVP